MRARQLHQRRRRRRAAGAARASATGSPRARSCSHGRSIPALRRRYARNAAVVVLPAVPVTPIVGTVARSSTRSPRQRTTQPLVAEQRDARRDLGRPDVEERLVVTTRGSRRDRRSRGSRRRAREAPSACCEASPGPASVTRRPSRVSNRASATASGSKPSISVRLMRRSGRGGAADPPRPAAADCARAPAAGSTVVAGVPVLYLVCGKPRSTLLVAGSGQREVTTLPRV